MKKELTVIDFFCGAGGFSEGFRQQGFKIVQGIDYWQPAITTHNLNHRLNDTTKSVLDFWSEDSGDVSEIEKLEDVTCIVGSPPCVSFSSSNKSGKADKTHGLKLIEAFLRVIAVKKHKPNSKLVCRFMENVPNSQKYVKEMYTFKDLNLEKWAKTINKKGSDIALKVRDNGIILNSGDYGAPQSRKRFICGEWCQTGEFIAPKITQKEHVTLGEVLNKLPKPNIKKTEVFKNKYTDPNYPSLSLNGPELTDHFYDTGLYIIEWEEAQYLKRNHSFMGKMSFPENPDKPCRTIMATRSAKTRESLILKSEYERIGNGEYRLPTIREISSLMGFPINYQFTGSEGSKWRQIGNAVSPHLSSALAKAIKDRLGLKNNKVSFVNLENNYKNLEVKLNTFSEAIFENPKKRSNNAKFRRHPYKSGNITVELMNYTEQNKIINGNNWYIQMYFGTGLGFQQLIIDKPKYKLLKMFLEKNKEQLSNIEVAINNYYNKISPINLKEFQKIYENDLNLVNPKNPINILKQIGETINKTDNKDTLIAIPNIIPKENIPIGQLLVILNLGKIIFNI